VWGGNFSGKGKLSVSSPSTLAEALSFSIFELSALSATVYPAKQITPFGFPFLLYACGN
jgi:hypothetical protein